MSLDSGMTQPALRQHVDVFVNNFLVNGARNYLRKTTLDAPWLNLGIMERTNTEAFYGDGLFAGLNIVGGPAYSLAQGFIHGYLKESAEAQITRAVASLDALGCKEIIFYHDESIRGLDMAAELGLELRFKPLTLLEWLIDQVKASPTPVQPLDADAAVQLPCSWRPGDGKNAQLEELFGLIGVRRAQRQHDYTNRICCGSRGYFGLASGHTDSDTERAQKQVGRNIEDAKAAGARYLVTTCPYCFAALATSAKAAGLIPIQIEGLVSLAVYNQPLPEGLAFV